jgi:hypothetical protein
LYAANVRAMMAAAGNFPTFELQWEDKLPFNPKSKQKQVQTKTS